MSILLKIRRWWLRVTKNAGYYTVDFDEPVDLESGERYAIVLYINTPGLTHPMAIEYNSGEAYMSTVNLDDGEATSAMMVWHISM